jgi:general secretion pathway protein E
VAQRLVRRLCGDCRRSEAADKATARLAGVRVGQTVWRPQGCGHCGQTGYVGRVGLYEVIRVDDRVRRLIAAEAGEEAINAVAFAKVGLRRRGDPDATGADAGAGGRHLGGEAVRVTRQERRRPMMSRSSPSPCAAVPGTGREDAA